MLEFSKKLFQYFILLTLLTPIKAFSSWSGRFTLGGYSSTERFIDSSGTGSDKNDFQTVSARLFLKGEELTQQGLETTLDLRDKHDFFDKLDKERLALGARNEFQARQLSIRLSKPQSFLGLQVGRFPVYEAGSAYVDGLQIESHWTPNLYSSFFGGLNPQKQGRSYLQFDSKSQIYGANLTYQNLGGGWDRNFYATHGIVNESYKGHTDRNYIFQNIIYQWQENSRLMTLLYYDLVPRGYVQNGNMTLQNGFGEHLLTEINYTALDVIEYSRRQGVLEVLPSSPYNESSGKLTYKINNMQDRYYLLASSGRREVDKLKRDTVELGFIKSQIFGPKWDLYAVIGDRQNFTSHDSVGRVGIGYFSRRWEFNLDVDSEVQKNNNGTTSYPLIVEGAYSYYISRNLFFMASGESATDQKVKILSAFFKIGYRFGNRVLAPLRDGAPPRGPL